MQKGTEAFADDLRAALRDRLGTELAPKAIRILDELMSDEKSPARVRVDAAKTLLDRGGFTAAAGAAANRDLSGITTYKLAELNAIIAEGRREMAAEDIEDAGDAVVEVEEGAVPEADVPTSCLDE